MIRKLAMTGLGTGYSPVASGTAGSALAIAIAVGVWAAMDGSSPWLLNLAWLAMILAASIICVAWGSWAVECYAGRCRKVGDPGQVVIDEFAGQWLSLVAIPLPGREHLSTALGVFALQFLLFRVFDVIKPPPSRQLERLPAGWGILFDDLGAAVYANLIGQVIVRVLL